MKSLQVEIPVTIEKSKSGLYFVTSPLIKGLLVSERTEAEALAAAVEGVRQLGLAAAPQ